MVKMEVVGCKSGGIQCKCEECPCNEFPGTCEAIREVNNLELCWLFYRGKE